ncbi:MAG: caa(3)-type oxidase subunit IV [Myxococcota bacterium]|jgi:caa(3)-type oxidase subunit IV
MTVHPVRSYVRVYLWLLVLTGLTVAVSLWGLQTGALLAAVMVASVKAALVGIHFMHLNEAAGFERFAFVMSLVFVALMAAVTLGELGTRDQVNPATDTMELRDEERARSLMVAP